jgi:hypothetical protein
MKYALLSIFALSLVSLSCKKDSTPAPVIPVDKYMTFTTGSSWNFEKVSNPSSASPVTTNYSITSSSRDTAINTKQYHVFSNNNGGANEYFYNNGNDYYTYRTLPSGLGSEYVEILYLKDNAAVNTQWAQTYPITYLGVPLNIILTNKIEERDLTKTVNGKDYTNVVRVSTNITVTGIPFPYTLTDEINYYYAPKYGVIKEETKINLTVTGFPASNFEEEKKLMSATLQ